jgi:hypothetical protein
LVGCCVIAHISAPPNKSVGSLDAKIQGRKLNILALKFYQTQKALQPLISANMAVFLISLVAFIVLLQSLNEKIVIHDF